MEEGGRRRRTSEQKHEHEQKFESRLGGLGVFSGLYGRKCLAGPWSRCSRGFRHMLD